MPRRPVAARPGPTDTPAQGSAAMPATAPGLPGLSGGGAPVSISAVAARAGVSIATVSRVVNGVAKKASPDTVARVRDAVQALGYRPMGAGRTLRQGRSRLVAVLAANLANPSMAAMAAVAEVALRQAGMVMVLCDTHDQPELQDEYLREMRAQAAQGFVLLGAVQSPVLRSLLDAGERIVFVNRRNPFGGRCDVGIDNHRAGADVAAWLVAQPRRPLALIHGRLSSSATTERVQGFRDALAALGEPLLPQHTVPGEGADHLDIGHQGMRALLARTPRPQAVFCTSDLIAYGAQRAAAEAGLQAGRDLVFMGFDDSPLNPWVAPWLNAVRVPYDAYGAAIVQALQGAEQGLAPPTVLPHTLVQRG